MLLNDGFADTELVNAVADGLDRLLHGPVFQFLEARPFHGDRPGILRARGGVVVRQTVGNNALEFVGLVGRNAFHHDHVGMVHRIGLGDVGVDDLARAHVLFKARNRVVGVNIDRVVDLHLQNKVGSAAEIKAQMNAVGDRGQQAFARPVFRNAKDTEQEYEQYPDDDD